jgi:hypothetical protein
MSPASGRGPLVLTLALARLGRLAGCTPADPPATRHSGRIASVLPGDGSLLVETERGPVLLLVAWDAKIEGARGVASIADVQPGDVAEWTDDAAQSVAMVDDLRVLRGGAR